MLKIIKINKLEDGVVNMGMWGSVEDCVLEDMGFEVVDNLEEVCSVECVIGKRVVWVGEDLVYCGEEVE